MLKIKQMLKKKTMDGWMDVQTFSSVECEIGCCDPWWQSQVTTTGPDVFFQVDFPLISLHIAVSRPASIRFSANVVGRMLGKCDFHSSKFVYCIFFSFFLAVSPGKVI